MDATQERPRRADDVALAGEMPDSSFATPQWLLQRGDRYMQVTELLYRIVEAADGTHGYDDIAILVGATTRRPVTGNDVRTLVHDRLVPAGIVATNGPAVGAPLTRRPQDPSPLRIHLRAAVIGARAIAPFARAASALYLPGIVIAAIAATIGSRVWLYREHGLADGFTRVISEPWHLLLLAAFAFASAAFHELGHAAALRAAGGRARGMGIGLYLIYPVFYTDVTDAYRLGRWRRVLTDAGGFYFNTLFALGLLAAYAVTRDDTLLVAVALVDLEILHQTIPLGRLDGYWLLTDITGVPDLFSIAAPFARGIARQRALLRPAATVVVAIYLALILPVLAFFAWNVARNVPRFVEAAMGSFLAQATSLDAALAARDLGAAAAAAGQGVLLVLPLLAVAFFLVSIARLFSRLFIRIAGRTSRQRLVGAASAVAAIALLAALWSPFGLGDVLAAASRETAAPHGPEGRVDPIDLATTAPALPGVPNPRTNAPVQNASQPVVPAPARTAAPAATQAPSITAATSPTSPTPAPTSSPSAVPPSPTMTPAPTTTGGTP